MAPILLDGNATAAAVETQLQRRIGALAPDNRPGLHVILVGENPGSLSYVGRKQKACGRIGIRPFETRLNAACTQDQVAAVIRQANADPRVHGILLQLPLPKGLDENALLPLIAQEKDADGIHPANMGRLLCGLEAPAPCTPAGVCRLLQHYRIDPAGRHVVILGRSNIVGKPLAALLMQKRRGADATVTLCHSRTPDMARFTRQADILVAAIGSPRFVKADMVREGAVVVDVGINRVPDPGSPRGYRLVGDVDFEGVAPKTSAITPVPGGVGPMTIAMLMANTFQAYCRSRSIPFEPV